MPSSAVIIADEPTSALDVGLQLPVVETLRPRPGKNRRLDPARGHDMMDGPSRRRVWCHYGGPVTRSYGFGSSDLPEPLQRLYPTADREPSDPGTQRRLSGIPGCPVADSLTSDPVLSLGAGLHAMPRCEVDAPVVRKFLPIIASRVIPFNDMNAPARRVANRPGMKVRVAFGGGALSRKSTAERMRRAANE